MAYQNPKIKYIFSVVAIIFVMTKLFTAVITLDDPSVFLVLKLSPSLDSQLSLSSVDEKKYMTLFLDENSFIGEKIYYLVVFYLWWLMPVVIVFFTFVSSRKKH